MAAKRNFEKKNPHVEVILGDIIDPATYWMVKKSDIDEIKALENSLGEVQDEFILHNLRVGKIVAVKNIHDDKWFRGRVQDLITVFGGEQHLEVFLIDHGIVLNEIKYPECVRKLPSIFDKVDPFCFKFKLDGLIPMTKTFQVSADRTSFNASKAKYWTEVSRTMTHIVVKTCQRSTIRVESYHSDRKPKSGVLILELDLSRMKLYKPYAKIMKKGGFASDFPAFEVNRALVDSHLAIFVEPDDMSSGKVLPKYTAGYHDVTKNSRENSSLMVSTFSRMSTSVTRPSKSCIPKVLAEQVLTEKMRKVNLCQALDDFMT